MKKIAFVIIVTGLAVGVPYAAQAGTSITKLAVSAVGVEEKPNVGAVPGSSSGVITLDSSKNIICFSKMKTFGLTNVIGAHIHLGATGIDGSVFVTFPVANFNRGTQTCLKIAHSVLSDIATHPNDYYFNVHTRAFPEGAVRGQLRRIS